MPRRASFDTLVKAGLASSQDRRIIDSNDFQRSNSSVCASFHDFLFDLKP